MTTFAEAAAKWYATAEKYAEFGAYDTEPRGVFAEIVCELSYDRVPEVPSTVRGWQLFSTMKGSFFAAKALERAALKVVKIGREDREGAIRYAERQGWV